MRPNIEAAGASSTRMMRLQRNRAAFAVQQKADQYQPTRTRLGPGERSIGGHDEARIRL